MTTKLISDAEIRRRKKLQARSSQVTGALGIGALGAQLVSTKAGGKGVARLAQLTGAKNPTKVGTQARAQGQKTRVPLLATSAGIGSVSSFNFARYTEAESRKRKPVSKRSPFEDGYYGAIGKAYDPEENRQKRNKGYENATIAVAGAGGAATAAQGIKTAEKLRGIRANDMVDTASLKFGPVRDVQPSQAKKGTFVNAPGAKVTNAVKTGDLKANMTRAVDAKKLKSVARSGGKTAIAAGVTGAAVVGNKKIREKRKGSWSPYVSKSAFGIDHD